MKVWRTVLLGLLALFIAVFALLCFLPASWALSWLNARLNGVHLQDVSGLVWDGRAGQVLSAKGENLGTLQWQLSRMALLGDNRLHVQLHGPRIDFVGSMRGKQAAEATWTDVQMRIDLDALGPGPMILGGWPRGILQATASTIELRGGWPWVLDGQVQWQDGVLRTRQEPVPLGHLQAELHAANGVIAGQLHDDGHGPLRIDGQLQLSPLARRFDAEAAPRGPQPALQRWLATLGKVDAGGVTHIHYSGGLAAALPGEQR